MVWRVRPWWSCPVMARTLPSPAQLHAVGLTAVPLRQMGCRSARLRRCGGRGASEKRAVSVRARPISVTSCSRPRWRRSCQPAPVHRSSEPGRARWHLRVDPTEPRAGDRRFRRPRAFGADPNARFPARAGSAAARPDKPVSDRRNVALLAGQEKPTCGQPLCPAESPPHSSGAALDRARSCCQRTGQATAAKQGVEAGKDLPLVSFEQAATHPQGRQREGQPARPTSVTSPLRRWRRR
jgi:hypothetical protein